MRNFEMRLTDMAQCNGIPTHLYFELDDAIVNLDHGGVGWSACHHTQKRVSLRKPTFFLRILTVVGALFSVSGIRCAVGKLNSQNPQKLDRVQDAALTIAWGCPDNFSPIFGFQNFKVFQSPLAISNRGHSEGVCRWRAVLRTGAAP
jgi:hypothetical protein